MFTTDANAKWTVRKSSLFSRWCGWISDGPSSGSPVLAVNA